MMWRFSNVGHSDSHTQVCLLLCDRPVLPTAAKLARVSAVKEQSTEKRQPVNEMEDDDETRLAVALSQVLF